MMKTGSYRCPHDSNNSPFAFTINPAHEVEHPALIILKLCLHDCQGEIKISPNKKNQVTVSSIQLTEHYHERHYLLRNTGTTMSKYKNYNHVGTTQVTGFEDLTQSNRKETRLVTSTIKLCYQLKVRNKSSCR